MHHLNYCLVSNTADIKESIWCPRRTWESIQEEIVLLRGRLAALFSVHPVELGTYILY